MGAVSQGALLPGEQVAGEVALRRTARVLLWIGWVVAAALGTLGAVQRLLEGHLPAGYGSYVPWGLWVALYFHGVGVAGGAFVLGAGGYVLDLAGFRSRTALRTVIVLSAAAILPSFLGVWFDLGHPERSHYIFVHASFTSMMAFNAWMYGVFMFVAAACFFLSYIERTQWLKPLLCLGILFSVLFPSQSGAFFGVVDAKPFWHSPLLPILFLTSAVTAGAALLLCVRWFFSGEDEETDRALQLLRWVTVISLAVYFVLEFAEFSLSLWNPQVSERAIELILWGPYWWVFWIIHLAIGGVTAFVLLVSRPRLAWVIGAFLVAVCFVSARLNVLIPGQAVAELEGLQEAFQHPRLKYMYEPSLNEYLVGLFMLASGMAVFFVGRVVDRRIGKVVSRKGGQS